MLFSVPCCDSQQIFFSWLSKLTHSAIKTCNLKEVESGNGILQNHCIDNFKANSKDNSENALLCSLLRQSTDFFSWLSKLTHSAIKTCNSKEVESGNGILQNHCIDNIKANSKDNSENALLSSLLRQSTDFFFSWVSKVTHSAIKTFNSKEVESGNGILQNHCSHNAKANSKDNSENGLLCSLLRHSTHFFLNGYPRQHSAIKTFNSKQVESGNGILQDQCHDNVEANSKDNTLSLQNNQNDLRLFST